MRIDEDELTPEIRSRLTSGLGRNGWAVLHVDSGMHIDWNFE